MNPRIAAMFAEAVKPPDRRPPWRWAEDHIKSLPFSPIPGAFRSANSPWVREPLEAIVNPRVKLVSIIASVQSSKTSRATFTHRSRKGVRIERFYSPLRKVYISHTQICRMHYWSNLNMKDMLARLRRNQDTANDPAWEVPDDVSDDYLAQLESGHHVQERGKWLWKQIGNRPNHYLDCESMQVAAAVMLKIVGREAAEVDSETV